MTRQKVYRVERENGDGPYNSDCGFYFGRVRWEDGFKKLTAHRHEMPKHPDPMTDLVWQDYDGHEREIFGFQHIELVEQWFGGYETLLHEYGFVLSIYETDKVWVRMGRHQCTFELEYATLIERRALAEGPVHKVDRVKRDAEKNRQKVAESWEMSEGNKPVSTLTWGKPAEGAVRYYDNRTTGKFTFSSVSSVDVSSVDWVRYWEAVNSTVLGGGWTNKWLEGLNEKEEEEKWQLGKLCTKLEPSKWTPMESQMRPLVIFGKCSQGSPMTSLSRLESFGKNQVSLISGSTISV